MTDALWRAFRTRVDAMKITRLELDHLSGLQEGCSGKLLGAAQVKNFGRHSLGMTLGATCCKLVLVEDPEATAKMMARARKRQRPIRETKSSRMFKRANCKFAVAVSRCERKIAPSRKCASYRNRAKCGYSNWTLINSRPLTNARCVSDSGELATRSSQNFGSIESRFRNMLRVRGREVQGRPLSPVRPLGLSDRARAKHTLTGAQPIRRRREWQDRRSLRHRPTGDIRIT